MRQRAGSRGAVAAMRRPGPQLALIAVMLVLTMGTWFAASAVAPALRQE